MFMQTDLSQNSSQAWLEPDFDVEFNLPYDSEEPVTVADALALVEHQRNK